MLNLIQTECLIGITASPRLTAIVITTKAGTLARTWEIGKFVRRALGSKRSFWEESWQVLRAC